MQCYYLFTFGILLNRALCLECKGRESPKFFKCKVSWERVSTRSDLYPCPGGKLRPFHGQSSWFVMDPFGQRPLLDQFWNSSDNVCSAIVGGVHIEKRGEIYNFHHKMLELYAHRTLFYSKMISHSHVHQQHGASGSLTQCHLQQLQFLWKHLYKFYKTFPQDPSMLVRNRQETAQCRQHSVDIVI